MFVTCAGSPFPGSAADSAPNREKAVILRRNNSLFEPGGRPFSPSASRFVGTKKTQPRRVALRFHQRRRFWRICADTYKDAQRNCIVAEQQAFCKRFLLLCNINDHPAFNKINLYIKIKRILTLSGTSRPYNRNTPPGLAPSGRPSPVFWNRSGLCAFRCRAAPPPALCVRANAEV